jgi:FixJ family two-component response regulator
MYGSHRLLQRGSVGERARALGDGVVCYLGKPINEERLVRCLHSALQSGEPQDENS